MTQEENTNNVIIAKYMGATIEKGWENSDNPMYHFETKPSFHPDHWTTHNYSADYMLYCCSWDWAMPVLEQISTLNLCHYSASYEITQGRCVIYIKHIAYTMPVETIEVEDKETIKAAYRAIIEFILWYNETKNQN